jgi:hypothetical protein
VLVTPERVVYKNYDWKENTDRKQLLLSSMKCSVPKSYDWGRNFSSTGKMMECSQQKTIFANEYTCYLWPRSSPPDGILRVDCREKSKALLSSLGATPLHICLCFLFFVAALIVRGSFPTTTCLLKKGASPPVHPSFFWRKLREVPCPNELACAVFGRWSQSVR